LKHQYTIAFVVTMCAVLLSCTLFPVAATAEDRPNIVFLMSDDQNTYSMGCYGNPDAKTPNLDRLAAQGIMFNNHYDTTAICMASRANVMTGLYEFKNGTNFDHGPMLEKTWANTYPMLLRKAGYLTAFAGKFGFEVVPEPGGKKRLPEGDFDRWGGGPGQTSYGTAKNKSMAKYAKEYPHASRAYGAFGRDFIRDAAKQLKTEQGKPFCLSISFKAPHRPVSPDPKYDHIYAGKKFTKPPNYGRQYGEHFSKQSQQGRQYERFNSWGYDKNYDEVMAKYHQQVYAVDVAVGMVRKALDEYGVAKNTVVIFTSDNGFLCGAHGYGSKVLPYEEASRVPLIIYDPRHANSDKAIKCDALTGNIDFAPTILTLAGLPVPDETDGRDLMPLYDDPTGKVRDSLYLINVWGTKATHSLSVVTRDWKYIFWSYAAGDLKETEELYHTGKDIYELQNLAGDPAYKKQLALMRAKYDKGVDTWNKDAVPYNKYTQYGVTFDRHIPWSKKEQASAAKKSTKKPAKKPGEKPARKRKKKKPLK
jgi:arylsulfatase A-like enzyme